MQIILVTLTRYAKWFVNLKVILNTYTEVDSKREFSVE